MGGWTCEGVREWGGEGGGGCSRCEGEECGRWNDLLYTSSITGV